MIEATRSSNPADFADAKKTNGMVKMRLAHGKRGSIVIPDMIFANRGGWHFFVPSFFGPPFLIFNSPKEIGAGSHHVMRFTADVCSADGIEATRTMIVVASDQCIEKYPDGAQLYECTIHHVGPLFQHASGRCRQIEKEFWISVFHHTTAETAKLIRSSSHFRGSEWNIQGTRKLKNVCYPYFTTLPRIRTRPDLERIAMSHTGYVQLLGTGVPPPAVSLPVYRESTDNRTTPIKVRIPAGIVAPAHLRLFDPDGPLEASYYEVVHPEIIRVGLEAGSVLPFNNHRVTPDIEKLKRFDYVICGNASSEQGLIAPYDEEETKDIVHLELLSEMDLFEFWQQHANSDQMSGRYPETRLFD